MSRLKHTNAPHSLQKQFALLRKLHALMDDALFLMQAHRIGPAGDLAELEQRCLHAACCVAEGLGALTVRDRLPPEKRAFQGR
jgi:hypothetical protein